MILPQTVIFKCPQCNSHEVFPDSRGSEHYSCEGMMEDDEGNESPCDWTGEKEELDRCGDLAYGWRV